MAEEPESCPHCNTHPAFDEISHGQFECRNCGAILEQQWVVIKEGEEPSDEDGDDLFDD